MNEKAQKILALLEDTTIAEREEILVKIGEVYCVLCWDRTDGRKCYCAPCYDI